MRSPEYAQYHRNKSMYIAMHRDPTLQGRAMHRDPALQGGAKRRQTYPIIHISGPSGAGKTTLGNKLKKLYGDQIVVKDIDQLRVEFIQSHYKGKQWTRLDSSAYQRYIDAYVAKQTKPLIWVGLNNMPWWYRDLYYAMHATHNFYIDIDPVVVLRQKCTRFFKEMLKDTRAMDDMVNDNGKFLRLGAKMFKQDCGANQLNAHIRKSNRDYKAMGYQIMTRGRILRKVRCILDNMRGNMRDNMLGNMRGNMRGITQRKK